MAAFLSILLLALVCGTGVAEPTARTYWTSVLPNTPMPRAVADLVSKDEVAVGDGAGVDVQAPGTIVDVGKGGVDVHAPGTTVSVGKGTGVDVHAPGTTVSVGKGTGVDVHAPGTTVGVGKGGGTTVTAPHTSVGVGPGGKGVGVHVFPKYGKPTYVHVFPNSPFDYSYRAEDTQLTADPRFALFFLPGDLHAGTKMTMQFTKVVGGDGHFLSRADADAVPFSAGKFPEIAAAYGISPESAEAGAMKQTLHNCEGSPAEGEKMLCATSLESMVDFAVSTLGTNRLRAMSTDLAGEEAPRQAYTITGVEKLAAPGGKVVTCHAEPYVYPVFRCHLTGMTQVYTVALAGTDGKAVDAVAVCHSNTSKWNPEHVAFKLLKVKPGTMPVCHFLPQDHVVWSRSA